ncbi:MAG: FecR domain-containing protein [Prosthecobacter sp.]|uniref:FecR domain-containing protein n=1 Tax=Prosthecobacter sp. TaxID=1965333 RepID=UPI0038FF96BE
MKQLSSIIPLIVAVQTTALMAGSLTLSSGNVRTQGNQVVTGAGARAEATVDQRGSVVRLGSNTAAQVGDRGDISLTKGVVLVSSGDGFLRRPAVQVSTPQGDVTVRGSAIVAAMPDGSVKMTCLEGSARGALGGQNMALNPGNLIVQRPEGTRDTVQVNLNTLTHSSALLDTASFKQQLSAAPEIRQEVAHQAQALGATLTLARNDSKGTQTMTINADGSANEIQLGEFKMAEVKSDGPGLLTRIFGTGSLESKTDGNANVLGPPLQSQNSTTSSASTASLRISGAVSGSNVFLSGSAAQNQATSLTMVDLSAGSVLVNGSTAEFAALNINSGGTVIQSGTVPAIPLNSISSQGLLRAGNGAIVITNALSNPQGSEPTRVVVGSGSLVLSGAAAQQFTSGNLTVTGTGGVTLTPINNNGGIIFTNNTAVSGGASSAPTGGPGTPAPTGGTQVPTATTLP